jgi:putative ABC transport system permease protein
VLLEAGVLGVVGATLGLAVGVLLAIGIRALMATLGLDLSGQDLVFAPRTVVAAYVVGVVVTVLAAVLPARRAGRVPPVAAMREGMGVAESSLRRRFAAGAAALLAGAATIGAGLLLDVPGPTWWVGAGVLVVMLGMTAAGPVLARPVVVAVGAAYRKLFGEAGRLATQNALRNPRRTAATASALMIGLSLVTAMAVLGASAKASVDRAIDQQFAGDLVVSNVVGSGFSTIVADRVERLDGVDEVTRFRYAIGAIEGQNQGMLGVDPGGLENAVEVDMREGAVTDLREGTVLLAAGWAAELGLEVGDALAVAMPSGDKEYDVVGLYEDNPVLSYPVTTTLDTLRSAGFTEADNYLVVTAAEGVAIGSLQTAVERLTADLPTVTVKDQAGFAAEQRAPVDQMLTLVYALLGLALVIAVLGIVNTLALSVIERTREIGLLRAVGLGRGQTRRMVWLEAAVISLVGGVLGALTGLGVGLALAISMRDDGLQVISAPWGQIAAFVVASAVVGVTAAALPARRAARLDILGSIAAD